MQNKNKTYRNRIIMEPNILQFGSKRPLHTIESKKLLDSRKGSSKTSLSHSQIKFDSCNELENSVSMFDVVDACSWKSFNCIQCNDKNHPFFNKIAVKFLCNRWCIKQSLGCWNKSWLVYAPNYQAMIEHDLSGGIRGFSTIADKYVSNITELFEYIMIKMNVTKDIKFATILENGKFKEISDLGEIGAHKQVGFCSLHWFRFMFMITMNSEYIKITLILRKIQRKRLK